MILGGRDLGGLFPIWLLRCASIIEQCSSLKSDSEGSKAAYIKEEPELLIWEVGIVSSLVFSFLACWIEPKWFAM